MRILQTGNKPLRRAGDGESLARRGVHQTRVLHQQDPYTYLTAAPYDAIFIDLDHPGYSGKALIGKIRRAKLEIPIFAFTDIVDLRFKIEILDLGADDVVTALRPIDELLARVRAVLRRLERHLSSTLIFGPVQVMMGTREIAVNGVPLRLSPNEYQLMELLIRRHGLPVSRESCLAYLYAGKDSPELKAIDVLVFRLRKKLADHGADCFIKNVWGHGFKLDIGEVSTVSYGGVERRRADAPTQTPATEALEASSPAAPSLSDMGRVAG